MTDHLHDHDRGLVFDLKTLYARRTAIRLLAGAGLATLVGCSTDTAGTAGPAATSSTATATTAVSDTIGTVAGSCDDIPEETAGPFPGDGSNGPNVLTQSGIVRSDITQSFGSSTTVAKGVPLTIKLQIQSTGSACGPLAGAAVYLWHCNIDGEYSLYSQNVTNENYLRGVQATDADGWVTFKSVFPAAYSGRWPHIHFEVYASLTEATDAGKISATSQIALPQAACDAVYATDGYEQSVQNMQQTSLTSDNVFGDDGGVHQLATMTGNVTAGYVATLTAGV